MSILVVYASMGGNTMMVAQKVEEVLKANTQEDVDLVDIEELDPQRLAEYPIVFMGASAWGDEGYNDFSQIFFEKFKDVPVNLKKTKFALFGLGETFYPVYCMAPEMMKEQLSTKGAKFIGKPLKIDGFPDDKIMEDVTNWVLQIVKLM